MKKYGKSSKHLFQIKESFFEENDKHLTKCLKDADIYSKQPRRKFCKNCEYNLDKISFTKFGVDYFICERCGHLNCGNED